MPQRRGTVTQNLKYALPNLKKICFSDIMHPLRFIFYCLGLL